MTRRFLTSCDVRFAARVLALIESLWRWSPDAEITVMCLDDDIGPTLREMTGGRISTVTIPDLIERTPELATVRTQRGAWEFYATLKPFFLDAVLDRIPAGELLSFVDSDTFFFSSPEPLFEEMGPASIALSPHRFSAACADLEQYGIYNAGFGIWRNDATGRTCVTHWSAECLEWCHCRVDGHRFMNQGYLSLWPHRYDNLVILQHPGENVGPWNVTTHHLEPGPDKTLVDGQPLIFFHFSNLFRGPDGRWKIHDHWPALHELPIRRHVFAPYLARVDQIDETLTARFGKLTSGSVRYPDPKKPTLDILDFPEA